MSKASDALLRELHAFGLSLPGAHGKAPWPTHDDLAVNDKTFAYLPTQGEPFSLSCKLPYTGEAALALPYASPTAYGWAGAAGSRSRRPMRSCRRWSSSGSGSRKAIAPRPRARW